MIHAQPGTILLSENKRNFKAKMQGYQVLEF
jgi:hypothetical protein